MYPETLPYLCVSHATASHDQLLQRKATIQFLFQTDIDYSDGSSESVAALVLLELEEVRTFQDVASGMH